MFALTGFQFISIHLVGKRKGGGGGAAYNWVTVIFEAVEFPGGLVMFSSIYMLYYVHIFCILSTSN